MASDRCGGSSQRLLQRQVQSNVPQQARPPPDPGNTGILRTQAHRHTHTPHLRALTRHRTMPLHKWPYSSKTGSVIIPDSQRRKLRHGCDFAQQLVVAPRSPVGSHTFILLGPFCLLVHSEQRPGGQTSSAPFQTQS